VSSGSNTGRVIRIALTVAVMAVVVWQVGDRLRAGSREPARVPAVMGEGGLFPDHAAERGHFRPVVFSTPLPGQPEPGVPVRTLAVYYARRAFSGAPPVIPHPVDPVIAKDMACNVCHEQGGYVEKFHAYTPLTPHPEFENCLQCHVEATDGDPFRDLAWVSVPPPPIRRPAVPGGPPPLPHPLRLREKCLTCHAGPAAPVEIRTGHPERTHCLQCHVPQEDVPVFERSSGQTAALDRAAQGAE